MLVEVEDMLIRVEMVKWSGGDRRDKRDRHGERGGQARGDYYCEIINVDNYF